MNPGSPIISQDGGSTASLGIFLCCNGKPFTEECFHIVLTSVVQIYS